MKKFPLLLLLILFTCPSLSAVGAGFGIFYTPGISFNLSQEEASPAFYNNINATGTMRFDRFPCVFGFGINYSSRGSSSFALTGFFDYLLTDSQLYNEWSFITAFGTNLSCSMTLSYDFIFNAGLRFSAGFTKTFYDGFLEFYLQQVINPVFSVSKNNSLNNFSVGFPVETGLRLNF